jgi:flavin-dependent dehydrogenase
MADADVIIAGAGMAGATLGLANERLTVLAPARVKTVTTGPGGAEVTWRTFTDAAERARGRELPVMGRLPPPVTGNGAGAV